MKRWDRYSASFTTNEEKKEDDIKRGHRRRIQNITTVKATGVGLSIFNNFSRQPDDIGKGLPKVNLSKNLPPIPPGS